jgi:hypothetical protein
VVLRDRLKDEDGSSHLKPVKSRPEMTGANVPQLTFTTNPASSRTPRSISSPNQTSYCGTHVASGCVFNVKAGLTNVTVSYLSVAEPLLGCLRVPPQAERAKTAKSFLRSSTLLGRFCLSPTALASSGHHRHSSNTLGRECPKTPND